MKKGDILSAKITDMNENGVGIAKIDGCVVFVSGAVTGDECSFTVNTVKKNYSLATVNEVIVPSEHRIEAECPYYKTCGGCTLAHVDFDYENEIKRNTVISALRRNGIKDIEVKPTLSAKDKNYRNKAIFHFDKEKKKFGYYSEKTNRVCESIPCLLLSDEMNGIAEIVSTFAEDLGKIGCEEIMIRRGTKGDIQLMVKAEKYGNVIFSIANKVIEKYPQTSGILYTDCKSVKALYGKSKLDDTLSGVKFEVSPNGFWQVNHDGAELICSEVLRLAGEIDFNTCIDLFCGSGTFGLVLASKIKDKKYYGVEINSSSIEDAKRNALINKINNIEFHCSDAADFRKKINDTADLVIVDPPRAGMNDSMLENLIAFSARNIIYISCDPNTLAKNCKELLAAGYEIKSIQPVNLFARAGHVETVCLLSQVK